MDAREDLPVNKRRCVPEIRSLNADVICGRKAKNYWQIQFFNTPSLTCAWLKQLQNEISRTNKEMLFSN